MTTGVPVLLLAYYFPPIGGAGTQRTSKLVKWLPAHGHRPVVVAAAPDAAGQSRDLSLCRDTPEGTPVHRVRATGPSALSPPRRALLAARLRVDREEWAAAAEPIAVAAGREHGVVAVVVTVSPYACAAAGMRVGRRLGVPVILDLRDPWALDGWRTYRTRLHARHDLRAMRRALREADAVVANTPAAAAAFRAVAGLRPDAVHVIPNGFDHEDFDGAPVPAERAPNGRLRLVHAGWLHDPAPRRVRRVRWRHLDETGRSGRYLLEALALLRSTRPAIAAAVELELVGHVDPGNRDLAARLGVSDMVRQTGRVPHEQSVARLLAADLVVVPLSGVPAGEQALVVPGKLYEALASGKPLLACLPPGDGRRLVEMTGAGWVCPPDDPRAIADAIADAVERRGALASADAEVIRPFRRSAMAARMAAVIDHARGAGPAPGPDPWEQVAAVVATARRPGDMDRDHCSAGPW